MQAPRRHPRSEWEELLQRSRSDPSLTPRHDPARKERKTPPRIIPARKQRPRWTSARRWPCTSTGPANAAPRRGPGRL